MLNRKKIGFGIIGLALVAAIYYFTVGSQQLTNEMKARVNTELTKIQQNGFTVQEREVKAKEEHFVLTFDDPEKIVAFFKKYGSDITLEEAQALKGFKVGADLKYLNSSYAVLSVDMYPLNLPPALSNNPELSTQDKAVIQQLNEILARKALLVHIDFNKMLTSFKGYIKDIHETIKDVNPLHLTLEGATFDGTVKEDHLSALTQTIKTFQLNVGDVLALTVNDLNNIYQQQGNSVYDSTSKYSIADINVSGKSEKDTLSLTVKKLTGDNKTSAKNNLASNKMNLNAEEIEIKQNTDLSKLSHTVFTFNVENLDIATLEALENVDANNKDETNRLVQELFSKGLEMSIPEFSVKKLLYQGKEIDGFSLTSTFHINKSANLAALQANPFAALSAINTKTKIVLSDALFILIAQDPRVMMLAMILPPKVVNGKKVYELELKDGKLLVNGKAML